MKFVLSRATGPYWDAFAVRMVVGVPLLLIGLAHIVQPGAEMLPIVEAMGLSAPELLARLAVAMEIAAALAMILGDWTRVGAALAIATMSVAFYAHLAIDVWPTPNEPPVALPLVILAGAAFLLWRGGGRWSLDARASRDLSSRERAGR